MGTEIERKHLVEGDGWLSLSSKTIRIEQGYVRPEADVVSEPGFLRVDGRAFSVDPAWHADLSALGPIRLGDGLWALRWRLRDGVALATLKSPGGVSRGDWEGPVGDDGFAVLADASAGRTVSKIRHHVHVDGHLFELDVFDGDFDGLVLVEIELESEDSAYPRPEWLGEEVTLDRRYQNAALAEARTYPAAPSR